MEMQAMYVNDKNPQTRFAYEIEIRVGFVYSKSILSLN